MQPVEEVYNCGSVLCTHHLFYACYYSTVFHNEVQRNDKFLQVSLLHSAFGNGSNEAQPAGCFS